MRTTTKIPNPTKLGESVSRLAALAKQMEAHFGNPQSLCLTPAVVEQTAQDIRRVLRATRG